MANDKNVVVEGRERKSEVWVKPYLRGCMGRQTRRSVHKKITLVPSRFSNYIYTSDFPDRSSQP